jgi:hypothetical protein
MDDEPKSNPAIAVSKTCWVYGERLGLTVVAEDRDDAGVLHHVSQATIPWAKVDAAKKNVPTK